MQQRQLGKNGPRVSAALVRGLLRRRLTTHVREIQQLTWSALQASRGDTVEPAPATEPAAPTGSPATKWEAWVGAAPDAIPLAALQAALDAHQGHKERTAAALGLSSRFVLLRLLRRHGLR